MINPGGTTLRNITTENGKIAGKVSHQEEEETRSCQSYNDFAPDGGRDEFACCRDNIVHKCNNVSLRPILYPIPQQKSSTNTILSAKKCFKAAKAV